MSNEYRLQVNTFGDANETVWTGNSMTYDTLSAAVEAAKNLAKSWTLVRWWRVIDETGELQDGNAPNVDEDLEAISRNFWLHGAGHQLAVDRLLAVINSMSNVKDWQQYALREAARQVTQPDPTRQELPQSLYDVKIRYNRCPVHKQFLDPKERRCLECANDAQERGMPTSGAGDYSGSVVY